jgi:Gram-negative bacterial TonB protein C-terminal
MKTANHILPMALAACIAASLTTGAHAQNWTNPAVDQASLKSVPPLASNTFPPGPPAPAKRAVMIAGSISNDDFPDAALNGGESGTVTARFVIDARGQVTSCTTNAQASLPSLSVQTCAILQQRFKFTPAQDAKGKPVSETRTQRVTWQSPLPFRAIPVYPVVLVGAMQGMRVPLQLIIDAKGRVGQCRIANMDHAAIAYQADICSTVAKGLTFPVKPGAYATDHVLWIAQAVEGGEDQQ